MAKEKQSKGSIPQKNVHLRLAFLYQAASYLADPASGTTPNKTQVEDGTPGTQRWPSDEQARYLVSHMKGVGRKSVIRLQREIKRSICKGCDQPLVSPTSFSKTIENKSKNGAKPGANVLVLNCQTCGTVKRFPVEAELLRKRKSTKGNTTPRADQNLALTNVEQITIED